MLLYNGIEWTIKKEIQNVYETYTECYGRIRFSFFLHFKSIFNMYKIQSIKYRTK